MRNSIKKSCMLAVSLICLSSMAQDYSVVQGNALSIDFATHVSHNQDLTMTHTTPNTAGKISNCLGYDGSAATDMVCDIDTSAMGTFNISLNSTDQLGILNSKTISFEAYDPIMAQPITGPNGLNGNFIKNGGAGAYTPTHDAGQGGMLFSTYTFISSTVTYYYTNLDTTSNPPSAIRLQIKTSGSTFTMRASVRNTSNSTTYSTNDFTVNSTWQTIELPFNSIPSSNGGSWNNWLIQDVTGTVGDIYIREWTYLD